MGTVAALTLKSGKTIFRAEVRKEGIRRTKSFSRKTDARLWIKEQEVSIHKGTYISPIKKHTIADAIERYEREVLPQKKPGTVALHAAQLKWFKTHIGNIKLIHLTSDILAKAREALRIEEVTRTYSDKKFRRASGTINRYFVPLLHCLSRARDDWGWIQIVPKLSKLKEPKGRTRYFTQSEAQKILAYFDHDPREDVRLVVRIAMTLGSRLGETCALQWRNINLEKRVIVFTFTKTDDIKGIPIPDRLFLEILNWKRHSTREYLFPTEKASKLPHIYDKVRRLFKKALLELEITDASFHNTRHTVGSWATQDGVNRRKVAEVLGHKALVTTDRYSHLDVEHLRPVVDGIEEKLLNKLDSQIR